VTNRFDIPVTALLFVAGVVASKVSAVPVVKLAVYAPAAFHQPDQQPAPVRIVGFENSRTEIRWVVSNTSDRAVDSVIIKAAWAPPPGCAKKNGHGDGSENGGSRYMVFIAPHGTAVISRDEHYPWRLVHSARDWPTPYLQVQFGVIGVFFRDGTTWPIPIEDSPHTVFWDPKLLESAARNCSEDADVERAWNLIDISDSEGVVFDIESSQAATLTLSTAPFRSFTLSVLWSD